jgi:polyisoprenoid-binding protein YceI
MNTIKQGLLLLAGCALSVSALGAEVKYQLDPQHTYPSFETDHFGGASIWRGKFNKSSGWVAMDAQAGTGSLEATIDLSSVSIGNTVLEDELRSDMFFDVAKYPTAVYRGTQVHFKDGKPVSVDGTLTMHGVTRPLALTIESFKCYPNPVTKKEVCGTESTGTFDRSDFGVGFGKDYGFFMKTTLHIQAEGEKQ